MALTSERRGRGKTAVLCGTPADRCTGNTADVSHSLRKQITRFHRGRDDAFRCYTRWLLSTGHTRVGAHDFKIPDGPVLMLGRKGQFGALLRPGKGTRSMPRRNGNVTSTGGLFVG